MKNNIYTIFLLLIVFQLNAQVSIPKQLMNNVRESNFKPTINQIINNYNQLKNNPDPKLKRDKKIADRWMFSEFPRLDIQDDGTFNYNAYKKAFKSILESNLFCKEDDKSDWKNIGPFNPKYGNSINAAPGNGWVSAVYANPNDPNEIFIGARRAGIFKTEDGGNTWVCLTDDLDFPVLGIKQIVLAPSTNSSNVPLLLAVTGDGRDPVQGGYMYSPDFGQTWYPGSGMTNNQELSPFEWISFYNNSTSQLPLAFAITSNQLVISQDGGETWDIEENFHQAFPSEVSDEYYRFRQILVSGDNIHVVQAGKWAPVTRYWKGKIIFDALGNFSSVFWDTESSNDYFVPTPPIIDVNNPFTYHDAILNINNPNHWSTGSFHKHRTGSLCPPIGSWHMIRTLGWEIDPNDNKLMCSHNQGSTFQDKEVIIDKIELHHALWENLDREFSIKCDIPKGAQLKVYLSSYDHSTLDGYYTCDLNTYDYDGDYTTNDEGLFSNEIYASDWANANNININGLMEVDISKDLESLYNYSIESPNTAPGITVQGLYLYYVLEFNTTNDVSENYEGGQFKMHETNISQKLEKPYLMYLSNDVNGRFYIQVSSIAANSIFKTTDSGNTFTNLGTIDADGSYDKNMLVASINDPNTFYHGTVEMPKRYKENGTSIINDDEFINDPQNKGHHDDYRSSHIVSISNKDVLFAGTDGGVAKVNNAAAAITPEIFSLNGNLSINMIYSIDIADKKHEDFFNPGSGGELTRNIIIGLQDNGTSFFNEGISGNETIHTGDGSITMIQQDNPYNYIAGDPQNGNSIKDITNGPNFSNDIVGSISYDASESYIGIKLEEYRFDKDRFIVGLQKGSGMSNARVVMNRSAGDTDLVEVLDSEKIGSIAVCDRTPKVAYLAEGLHRNAGVDLPVLYRTTNDGVTTSDWEGINPIIYFECDNNGSPIGTGTKFTDLGYLGYGFNRFINALAVDDANDKLVYIGMSGVAKNSDDIVTNEFFRVLRSFDGGENFCDWSKGLPALPVNYLLDIESGNHLVFCATDAGVYYRNDDMDQWECFSNNLAKTQITDLSYSYCSNELYASTYGRGVWKTSVNLNLGTSVTEEITANTVWDTDRDLHENILVKSGYELKITSKIDIGSNRKIMIEPGARLIIDGGVLTNACGEFWDGIEVWGNKNQHQIAANQGRLITRNEARIEYAKTAIKVWKEDLNGINWDSTGGMLTIQNTTFFNNQIGISYQNYHNINNGIEINNIGSVSNCSFIWDTPYSSNNIPYGIKMNHINGIRISGSDFIDDRTTNIDYWQRAVGIFSLDSGYKVVSRATSLNPELHHEFALTGGYDVNNFIQLKDGVKALNANSEYTIQIDHSNFENVFRPVHLSVIDNANVTRNLFKMTSNRPSDIPAMYSLILENSTGFKVEGNKFESTDFNSPSIGVMTINTGSYNNMIYRNKFKGIKFSNFAAGINASLPPAFPNFPFSKSYGLEWTCNEFINCEYDIYVSQFVGGARKLQGTYFNPAENIFTNSGSSFLEKNIAYNGYNLMHYFNNNTSTAPSIIDPNVVISSTPHVNECESSFENNASSSKSNNLTDKVSKDFLEKELKKVRNLIVKDQTYLSEKLENGDQKQLYEKIENLNLKKSQTLYRELKAKSPYLSEKLLKTLGGKIILDFPETLYFDLLEDNIEIASSNNFEKFLKQLLRVKSTSLSDKRMKELQKLKDKLSKRGIKEMKLVELKREEQKLVNSLIYGEFLIGEKVNWNLIEEKINDRKSPIYLMELVDVLFNQGKTTEMLVTFKEIEEYAKVETSILFKKELLDFVKFKKYILSITNNIGFIKELTKSQVNQLKEYSKEMLGRASIESKNILCFYTGDCESISFPILGQDKRNKKQGDTIIDNHIETKPFFKIKVLPNPNHGEFKLDYPLDCEISSISIYDLLGKKVPFTLFNEDSNSKRIKLNTPTKGVKLLKIICKDGSIQLSKIIVK